MANDINRLIDMLFERIEDAKSPALKPNMSLVDRDEILDLLEELRAQEEAKREQVVEAKKETSSIEKLKEKKLEAYHKEEAKSEELFIEEFVSSTRAHAAS